MGSSFSFIFWDSILLHCPGWPGPNRDPLATDDGIEGVPCLTKWGAFLRIERMFTMYTDIKDNVKISWDFFFLYHENDSILELKSKQLKIVNLGFALAPLEFEYQFSVTTLQCSYGYGGTGPRLSLWAWVS